MAKRDETGTWVHRITVPQRVDGVAHALHAIYDNAAQTIPRDLAILLQQVDDAEAITRRRSMLSLHR
jgi:hypothetical protein